MRNTASASTTRNIGPTPQIGRGRLNWHAALPSRREFAFDAANVFDDSKNVSRNYTRETKQCFQRLGNLVMGQLSSSTGYFGNLRRTSGARPSAGGVS